MQDIFLNQFSEAVTGGTIDIAMGRKPKAETVVARETTASVIELALAEYLRNLIADWQAGGQSYAKIAKQLQVSKTWVQMLHKDPPEKHSVGHELELRLAELFTNGSVERLRQKALSATGRTLPDHLRAVPTQQASVDEAVRTIIDEALANGTIADHRLPENLVDQGLLAAAGAALVGGVSLGAIRRVIARHPLRSGSSSKEWHGMMVSADGEHSTPGSDSPRPLARKKR